MSCKEPDTTEPTELNPKKGPLPTSPGFCCWREHLALTAGALVLPTSLGSWGLPHGEGCTWDGAERGLKCIRWRPRSPTRCRLGHKCLLGTDARDPGRPGWPDSSRGLTGCPKWLKGCSSTGAWLRVCGTSGAWFHRRRAPEGGPAEARLPGVGWDPTGVARTSSFLPQSVLPLPPASPASWNLREACPAAGPWAPRTGQPPPAGRVRLLWGQGRGLEVPSQAPGTGCAPKASGWMPRIPQCPQPRPPTTTFLLFSPHLRCPGTGWSPRPPEAGAEPRLWRLTFSLPSTLGPTTRTER